MLTKFVLETVVTLPAVHNAFLNTTTTTMGAKTHGEDKGMKPLSGGEPETYQEAVTSNKSKQ